MSNDTDLSSRVEWILEGLQRIARGEYEMEEPPLEHGDEIDAIAGGLVMVAEELAANVNENRRLQEALLQAKEETIAVQRAAIMELSTPVLQVWEGIVVMPLIGTIDTARARAMTERLLEEITRSQATMALIDITGVAVVDSHVANHLALTIQAARLLGAECLLTGVSPVVAQTMVHVGLSLEGIVTKGSLQSGLQYALRATGRTVR